MNRMQICYRLSVSFRVGSKAGGGRQKNQDRTFAGVYVTRIPERSHSRKHVAMLAGHLCRHRATATDAAAGTAGLRHHATRCLYLLTTLASHTGFRVSRWNAVVADPASAACAPGSGQGDTSFTQHPQGTSAQQEG